MNPVVLIPTFITEHRRKVSDDELIPFDHQTPLSSAGELGRCLSSLEKVEGLGLIIITVVADQEIAHAAKEKVKSVVDEHPDLSILVIGEDEINILRQRMEQLKIGDLENEIGLGGNGAVRNLGLLIANVFGFDAVVFLADDEVVEDPQFLKRAMYGLGKLTRKGIPILAKTGYYINENGSYLSKWEDAWYNRFWQKGRAFNEWISAAMKGPRLSRSNHVCGGCLAIHKEAFRRLAFDPWIIRGEDLDYMLDLRMYGSDIWFDNTWVLHHLPPTDRHQGARFLKNIYRWLYEYRKLEYSRALIDLQQVKPQSLMPYPGPFLEPGLTKRIRITAFLRSLVKPNKRDYRRIAKAARHEAATYAEENCSKYFEFQYIWPEVMTRLQGDEELSRQLLASALSGVQPETSQSSIDPGQTSEIRLDLSE